MKTVDIKRVLAFIVKRKKSTYAGAIYAIITKKGKVIKINKGIKISRKEIIKETVSIQKVNDLVKRIFSKEDNESDSKVQKMWSRSV